RPPSRRHDERSTGKATAIGAVATRPPGHWDRQRHYLVTEVIYGDRKGKERMNAKKRQLWIMAGIILVLILSACGSSTSGGSGSSGSGKTALKIMVGGLSKQIYLPNELTQRLGYFSAQGLDVTLIDEASGQSSENEVLAGQVDAGSGSYNHTIELQAAGKNMEAVVLLNIA